MTKIDALRRFFLPCLSPPTAVSTTNTTAVSAKKRLSASLRDDIDDNSKTNPRTKESKNTLQETSQCSSSSSSSSPADEIIPAVPQRPSKTMVIGTIFGQRKGHVWFCVQHDRLSTKPLLLLELSIQTHQLVHEMGSGTVRIALECPSRSEISRCALRSAPFWTMYCNGRKVGFAVRRSANEQDRMMLKKMQSMTVGAGVIPSGFGFGLGSEEVMYMRANYEHLLGSSDSESFHLINPDASSAQELSVFLLRQSR